MMRSKALGESKYRSVLFRCLLRKGRGSKTERYGGSSHRVIDETWEMMGFWMYSYAESTGFPDGADLGKRKRLWHESL